MKLDLGDAGLGVEVVGSGDGIGEGHGGRLARAESFLKGRGATSRAAGQLLIGLAGLA